MKSRIKELADAQDLKALKYVFVDSLDVDPTFVRYEDDYNYCKSIPGLLEPYIELTPFRTDPNDWNDESYWVSLKKDLVKNFSDARMSHMRQVAKVYLAEKVQRILAERATAGQPPKPATSPADTAAVPSSQTETAPNVSAPKPDTPPAVLPTSHPSTLSKAEEQQHRLEEERRKLQADYEKAERQQRAEAARVQEAKERYKNIETPGTDPSKKQAGADLSKKAIGIAVVAIAVVAAALLILVPLLK